MQTDKHPSTKRYPPEMRERAVRLVVETIERNGERYGVVSRIARQLDIATGAVKVSP